MPPVNTINGQQPLSRKEIGMHDRRFIVSDPRHLQSHHMLVCLDVSP